MPSASTTLSAPNASSSFDCNIISDVLYISGKSWKYHTYTIPGGTWVNEISNVTSVALRIKYADRSITIFPREQIELADEITGGTTLTIYPCVEMNLFSLES
jgi:hypothetical protein